MKKEPVPRYIVQLSDGEVELDALEIFALFRRHKADFRTLIRPVEGGDWRKIGEEKAFASALPFLYTQGRYVWWLPWFHLMFLVYPLLLFFWDRVAGFWPIFWLMLWAMLESYILGFCGTVAKYFLGLSFQGWRSIRMLIPWWNSVEGYFLFRDCATGLPPRSARFLRGLNPFIWISLAIFYCSFFLASPDTVGGRRILLCYGVFWLLLFASSIPISRELKRRDDAWRASNPKPLKSKEKSPQWNRFSNRELIRTVFPEMLLALVCLAVAVLVFLIPWRIIGEIRLDNAVKYRLPVLPLPHAASELEKIVLPDISIRAVEAVKEGKAVPADLRAELKKIEPQLNAIRGILRKYPTLGLRRGIYAEKEQPIDICSRKLREYLWWRRLELRAGGDFREVLRDLERLAEYAAEEPTFGIYHLELIPRMRIVAANLRQFSDEELAREKAYWCKLAALADSVVAGSVLAQNDQWTEFLIQIFSVNVSNRFLLFFFADGLRATFLEYSHELADILSRDAWQSRDDFRKFQTRMDRLGCLHGMWASSNNLGLKKSEKNDREPSPDYSMLNMASGFSAVCRLAEAGIGLEQYRRLHGRYPEKPELPTDPFDGKPMRYLPGLAIYSVGADLVDDGGRAPGNDNSTFDIAFPLEDRVQ